MTRLVCSLANGGGESDGQHDGWSPVLVDDLIEGVVKSQGFGTWVIQGSW